MLQIHKVVICFLALTNFAHSEIIELSCVGRQNEIVNNSITQTQSARMTIQIALGRTSISELFPLDKISNESGTRILNTDVAIIYKDDLKKSTFLNLQVIQSTSTDERKGSYRATQTDSFFKGEIETIFKLTSSKASVSSSSSLEINRKTGSITYIDKSIIPSSPDIVNFYEHRVVGKCDLVSSNTKKF
jgi:hypothetical protein